MAASNQADTTRWEIRLLASLQKQLTEAVGELRKIQDELREERKRGQALQQRIEQVEARINETSNKNDGFVLSTGSPLSELAPTQEAQVQARDPAKRTNTTALSGLLGASATRGLFPGTGLGQPGPSGTRRQPSALPLSPIRARRHPMSTRSSTRGLRGTQKIPVVPAVAITDIGKGKRKLNNEDDRGDSSAPKRNRNNRLAPVGGSTPEPCIDCGHDYCTCYLARQDNWIQRLAQEDEECTGGSKNDGTEAGQVIDNSPAKNYISAADHDFGQHFVPCNISAVSLGPRYLEVPIPSRQEIYDRWEEEKDEVYRDDEELICGKCFSFTGEICTCAPEAASATQSHQRRSGFNFDQYGRLIPCSQCGSNYCICLNPDEEL